MQRNEKCEILRQHFGATVNLGNVHAVAKYGGGKNLVMLLSACDLPTSTLVSLYSIA